MKCSMSVHPLLLTGVKSYYDILWKHFLAPCVRDSWRDRYDSSWVPEDQEGLYFKIGRLGDWKDSPNSNLVKFHDFLYALSFSFSIPIHTFSAIS